MIHISPWSAAQALFAGASRYLVDGGILYLYGPYKRGGAHTAPSNEDFRSPIAKPRSFVGACAIWRRSCVLGASAGFECDEPIAMPANNFSLVFRKRAAQACRHGDCAQSGVIPSQRRERRGAAESAHQSEPKANPKRAVACPITSGEPAFLLCFHPRRRPTFIPARRHDTFGHWRIHMGKQSNRRSGASGQWAATLALNIESRGHAVSVYNRKP